MRWKIESIETRIVISKFQVHCYYSATPSITTFFSKKMSEKMFLSVAYYLLNSVSNMHTYPQAPKLNNTLSQIVHCELDGVSDLNQQ